MATGPQSTATGAQANASGQNSTAAGFRAQASGSTSTAIGFNASATASNSAAFGAGASATRANQISVGTGSNTYTTAGITSGASLAAQSGPLQVVTSDAGGNLATDGGAIFGSLGQLQNSINQLQQEDKRLRAGIAMAAAIPHSVVPYGKTVAFDIDWANYAGSNAIGFDGAVLLGQFDFSGKPVGVQAHAGAGFSSDSNAGGRAIGKAGVHFDW
jgi:hypothetical protein